MTTDITRAIEASGAREAFARDGVAYLPGVLPEPFLGQLLEAWQWSMANPGPLASPLVAGRKDGRQDLCNPGALPVYRDVLLQSPVADLTAALWGVPDVWFMYEQVFHKVAGAAVGTPWHQDTSYLMVNGPHLLVMWITFEAIPAPLSLEFVRGSHRGPLYNTSRFDLNDPTQPIFPSDKLPNLPNIEAERDRHDIVSFAVTPGDVVVFHPSMLHGGGATDPAHPERRTLTLRFFGPDAHFEMRPAAAGPFYGDLKDVAKEGAPFRHPRFLKLR